MKFLFLNDFLDIGKKIYLMLMSHNDNTFEKMGRTPYICK